MTYSVDVDHVFDASGDFNGQWPDDLFRFADSVDGHPDILLGDDVLTFARRAVEEAGYAIRAQKISQQIGQYSATFPYSLYSCFLLSGISVIQLRKLPRKKIQFFLLLRP